MPTRELVSRDVRRMVLGAESLDYVLVRRRGRRGVGLKVDETGLTVSAPATLATGRIESVVRESERWVLRKLVEWSARRVPEVAFREGALVPYLGEALTLRLFVGAPIRAAKEQGELRLFLRRHEEEAARKVVIDWYKRAAREYLAMRTLALARVSGVAPPRVVISSARARWGSCNSSREVRLAWRLMKAPPAIIDYVVCHELAHLRHMDHSPRFWAEVERLCPDYRSLRARLFATDHLYRSF